MPKYLRRAGGAFNAAFSLSLPDASAHYGNLCALDIAGMRWTDFLIMLVI